jgi:oxygen-independent coproporphyrinogen-3 oxidase
MDNYTQLARLGLFDAKVPRYTSYPTAPQFTTGVQAREYTSWLGEVAPDAGISAYVHIPFCRRLCWFCACRTQGVRSNDPVISYLATLKDEIIAVVKDLPKGVRLSRLHWGGGTPTLLSPEQMRDLADTIRTHLPFAEDIEFSVEVDPNEVDDARLDALAGVGMNRASIGVQDFDPDIQKTIGRDQSFEVTRQVADKLRALGVHSLNTDILYGLPHQDQASISDTTRKLISLSPDRVALYGYAHVPWMARRQTMIPEDALPTATQRLNLYDTARDLFLAAGYQAIGIDHFAKPEDGLARAARSGTLRRNFQGYTDDTCDTLIGFGASAISRLPNGYVQNASATAAYLALIREGKKAAARGHRFTPEDHLRGRVIEELMCQFQVSLSKVETELPTVPVDLRAELARVHQKYAPFTQLEGDTLKITPNGQPLARMIAHDFDAYAMEQAGHSLAI